MLYRNIYSFDGWLDTCQQIICNTPSFFWCQKKFSYRVGPERSLIIPICFILLIHVPCFFLNRTTLWLRNRFYKGFPSTYSSTSWSVNIPTPSDVFSYFVSSSVSFSSFRYRINLCICASSLFGTALSLFILRTFLPLIHGSAFFLLKMYHSKLITKQNEPFGF